MDTNSYTSIIGIPFDNLYPALIYPIYYRQMRILSLNISFIEKHNLRSKCHINHTNQAVYYKPRLREVKAKRIFSSKEGTAAAKLQQILLGLTWGRVRGDRTISQGGRGPNADSVARMFPKGRG